MSKCDNCHNPAEYKVESTWAAIQHFCDLHLPVQYNKKSLPDFVKRAERIMIPVVEEVKPKRVKKTAKAE